MKLATFESGGAQRIGIVDTPAATVIDLQEAHRKLNGDTSPFFLDMMALIEGGKAAIDLAAKTAASVPDEAVLPLTSIRLLAPIPVPAQIRDFFAFEQHFKNVNAMAAKLFGATPDIPPVWYEFPLYTKCNRFSVIGTGQDVKKPRYAEVLDYELELACVLGKRGVDIPRAAACDYIFGFTIFNDVSARDFQMREQAGQLGPAKGKDFDTGNVMGPWIVTLDEIGDPHNLTMVARVNDEEWSRGNSGGMYHRFDRIIEHLSMNQTIFPGEIIGSGTAATGSGLEQGRFPPMGSVVELEIEKIGIIRNRFIA
jgi:2-keto-4-pentenoate hydratase/2-oxohepta-3-ene-1,7-dioic acid hydratase in catechol pathway